MKGLTVTSGVIFMATILLYYFGGMLPIQITSLVIKKALILFGLINTFGLFFLVFNYTWADRISSKMIRGVIWAFVIIVIMHNFIWTAIKISASNYEDDEIVSVDKSNKRRRIITQHANEGVFGDSYRTVQVYELTSFLRLIENERTNR